jgi:hypothetical protein
MIEPDCLQHTGGDRSSPACLAMDDDRMLLRKTSGVQKEGLVYGRSEPAHGVKARFAGMLMVPGTPPRLYSATCRVSTTVAPRARAAASSPAGSRGTGLLRAMWRFVDHQGLALGSAPDEIAGPGMGS